MDNTNVNSKIILLILSPVLFGVSFILMGCGLFDDNSQPAIELTMGETDQLVGVNSTRMVEFYVTDADDDDTHTVTAFSANTAVAAVLVNTADLTIRGIGVGNTIVRVSVTDDSGQDNATAELVLLV